MAHISTNPPWEDFPSRATLITALSLENIEKAIDAGGAFMKLTDEKVAALEDAPPLHAGTHAAGGGDPVTPESIAAAPGTFGIYEGHVDDAPEGFCYVSSGNLTAANGYPPMPNDTVGYLTTVRHHTNVYLMQRLNGQSGVGTEYIRTKRGPGDWNPWGLVKFDSGWRNANSWLLNGWTQGAPGRCTIRRIDNMVYFQAYISGTDATSDTVIGFPEGSGFSGYDFVLTWQQLNVSNSGAAEVQRNSREAVARGVPRANIFISGSWVTTDDPPGSYPIPPA